MTGKPADIRGALVQIGSVPIDRSRWDWVEVERNSFFSPDAGAVENWSKLLDGLRKAGSSAGAIVEVVARGVPAEFLKLANDKLAAINSAYEKIQQERGLKTI